MKKQLLTTGLLAGLLLTTPVMASANSKPGINSKHWQTNRVVKLTHAVKGIERATKVKNKQLTLTNKIKATKTIKKGTELGVRYMGSGYWQVVGNGYPSSKKGVWLVNRTNVNWFTPVKVAKALSSKWSTQHYVTLKKAVSASDMKVTSKNNKLTLTNQTLKTATLAKGTQGYVRNMGNGVWQFSNTDHQSNSDGVWIVKNDTINWFTVTKAPKAKQYQINASHYQTASSNTITWNSNGTVSVYAPYGFKPLAFDGGFTLNPGQKVDVQNDTANNRYIITYNNQKYALGQSSTYQFSTANAQHVSSSNNTIESTYAPSDSAAIVPNGYQPANGNLWIQVGNDGSPVQYYFYTTQNHHSGWVKAKVVNQDGKNTIVPE